MTTLLVLERVLPHVLSWRKLLWREERQVVAGLNGFVDTGRCRLNEEGFSENVLGIGAFGVHRPLWPRPCGHGLDPTDVVFDGAVVGDMDAVAWVADGWLQTKLGTFGLMDSRGLRPEEEKQGQRLQRGSH